MDGNGHRHSTGSRKPRGQYPGRAGHGTGRSGHDAAGKSGDSRHNVRQPKPQDRPQDARQIREDRQDSRETGSQPGDGGVRLNKYLADAGICSRRKADTLIEEGRVTLNGRPARQGDKVCPGDDVQVDGRRVQGQETTVCLLLHKPVRVVSTVHDPQGRPTVLDFVPQRYRHLRLYPVGRLDYYSEGLLLLTNDGALAQRLMHPSHGQHKRYTVLVRGLIPAGHAGLATMRKGMRLQEGDATRPCQVTAHPTGDGNTELHFVLQQGLNRQIRRMCRDTGITILKLKRVAEGGLELGELPPGAVRELAPAEIEALKRQA